MSDGEDLDLPTLALLVAERLRQRTQTHPVSTLAGVAGAGYVLAAGLPDVALRVGVGLAIRGAAGQFLENALAATEAPES